MHLCDSRRQYHQRATKNPSSSFRMCQTCQGHQARRFGRCDESKKIRKVCRYQEGGAMLSLPLLPRVYQDQERRTDQLNIRGTLRSVAKASHRSHHHTRCMNKPCHCCPSLRHRRRCCPLLRTRHAASSSGTRICRVERKSGKLTLIYPSFHPPPISFQFSGPSSRVGFVYGLRSPVSIGTRCPEPSKEMRVPRSHVFFERTWTSSSV